MLAAQTKRALPRPFLKWAGGKSQLLPELDKVLIRNFNAYHEPFLGGGALSLALFRQERLAGHRVRLADGNAELMDTWRILRDRTEEVIEQLRLHRYDKTHYYSVRALNPAELAPEQRAARLIFLNHTCFNGLYRVNQKGRFNVPFGRYKNPTICDEPNLRAVARALQGVELDTADFVEILSQAAPGDLVYFDPPYVPLSATSHFADYLPDGFTLENHARLARVFAELAGRGVHVILSNSDTPWVRECYRDFAITAVPARRNINCNKAGRGKVSELSISSDSPPGDLGT
jgi:DNA adenine methylase